MTGFQSKKKAAKEKLIMNTEDDEFKRIEIETLRRAAQDNDTQVYAGRKRGSIALARSLCYQINGAADDSDDIDGGGYGSVDIVEILSAEVVRLQKALATPEQKPTAFYSPTKGFYWAKPTKVVAPTIVDVPPMSLFTAPQRPWVGLTPEEVLDLFDVNNVYGSKWIEFARTVEAKLKENNK